MAKKLSREDRRRKIMAKWLYRAYEAGRKGTDLPNSVARMLCELDALDRAERKELLAGFTPKAKRQFARMDAAKPKRRAK